MTGVQTCALPIYSSIASDIVSDKSSTLNSSASAFISQSVDESVVSVETITSCAIAVPDDPSIYDGLSEDEAMELRYTRERYARFVAQTQSCTESSALSEIEESILETVDEVNEEKILKAKANFECDTELKIIHSKLDRLLFEFQQLRSELTARKII